MLYRAYGLRWQSEIPLTRFSPDPVPAAPDIAIELVQSLAPRELLLLHPGASVQRGPGGLRYTSSEATLDLYDPGRIEVLPGPDWTGELPAGFYGTLTALMMARRGAIPLHGSAVEIDGRAVLLCGESGAGKSTLAAGLIAHGARLISDDLSILHPERATGRFVFYAGRRTLRLFESTAGYLARAVSFSEPPSVADRKLAVTPPISSFETAFPLTTVMLLNHSTDTVAEAERPALLAAQLFRPAWMARMPGRELRQAAFALAAKPVSLVGFAVLPVRDSVTFLRQSAAALKKVSQ